MEAVPVKRTPIPLGVFFSVFMIMFTVVFGWTAISTAIAPKTYAGYARIEIHKKSDAEMQEHVPSDYTFIKTEMEFISSEVLLQKVVAGMNLNVVWGKKYFDSQTLKSWESLELLKNRMTVKVVPDTTLIGIEVYGDDPEDAAALANATANAYVNYTITNSGNVTAQIVDNAYPMHGPIRPNVAFNIVKGTLIGIVLGFMAGMAVAGFVYMKNRNDSMQD